MWVYNGEEPEKLVEENWRLIPLFKINFLGKILVVTTVEKGVKYR